MYSTVDGRSFYDFSLLDLASRGFWGSCLLVARFKWRFVSIVFLLHIQKLTYTAFFRRHPISLAGIISIISVISSPITQQAIEYPTRSAGSYGRSSVGISRHWDSPSWDVGVTSVGSALMEGLYSVVANPPNPLDAVCPTASCSFSPYESLAMCAKVADVSSLLDVSTTVPEDREPLDFRNMPHNVDDAGQPTTAYYTSLPNNMTFDTNHPFSFISQPGNSSLAFIEDEAFPSALFHMFIIHTRADDPRGDNTINVTTSSLPTPEFGAFEILFYICVNTYETRVEEGESHTVIKSSTSTPLRNEDGGVTEVPKLQCDYSPWYINALIKCSSTTVNGSMTLAGGGDSIEEKPSGGNNSFSFEVGTLGATAYEIATSSRCMLARFRVATGGMESLSLNKVALWLRDILYGSERNIADPQEQLLRLQDYYNGIVTSISNT